INEPTESGQQAKIQSVYDRFRDRDIKRDIVCECYDLSRRNNRQFSLSEINLTLRLGEVTGVVGENASGKTTLLRVLAGELKHSGGTLWYPALGSRSPQAPSWGTAKRFIAYVPQVPGRLYGSLKKNLHYAAATHGIRGRENEMAVQFIVERLGL